MESGRKADRIGLAAALALCRARRATLLIAKLDRLARSVAFISNLMDGGVDFVAADMPSVNRLTVFVDPQCSFSRRAMQQLQLYIASGRVQAAVVPVSLLDHEDQGLSTTRAETMLGLPREQMVIAWAENRLAGPIEASAVASLQGNMMAADRIGLVGTPTFIWRKAEGSEGRADGIPAQPAPVQAIALERHVRERP